MFRQVTAHYKPGKFDLLNKRLENDIIPLLKKQAGFRDELSFYDKEEDEAVAMSFWDTRQDAEKYERDIYPEVSRKLEDAIEGEPMVRSFEVNNSTWYVCAMRSLYAPSLSLVLANLRGFSLRALLDSDSGNQRPRTVTPARLKDRKTASVPYSAPRSTTMHDECRQIVGTVIASITGAIVISRLS